jgi:hypothetical protein
MEVRFPTHCAQGRRPIVPILINYPTKTFTVGALIETTGDTEADMTRIRAMFAGYKGKHRGCLMLAPLSR